MSLPTLTGTGRLTADPELRIAPSGTAVCKFNLAFNSRKKDPNTNQWVDDQVFFIGATAFNKLAENIAESLSKGAEVVVTGRLQTRQWETKEGEKRSTSELLIDSIGPGLTFATAKPVKAEFNGNGRGGDYSPARASADTNRGSFGDDAPPF